MPSAADPLAPLVALASLDVVQEYAANAREACNQLRMHEALRRRIPEAAAESRVRGARESAMLEGAQWPLPSVRRAFGGDAWEGPEDPVSLTVRGAIAATAESERAVAVILKAPLQAIARLHVAATGEWLEAGAVGRPRAPGETCGEFADLGPAPSAEEARMRLSALADLLSSVGAQADRVPGYVVAALAHAEIVTARPFVRGNGVVARAVERAVLQATGLDRTGVAVPEAGWTAQGGPAYVGSLAAYQGGSREGLDLWFESAGKAVLGGVLEGMRICDAVRAGRLNLEV